jgi:hypothetical protein
MLPSHVVLVVEAAWLLLSLVFKQDDPCASALQVRLFVCVLPEYPRLTVLGHHCTIHTVMQPRWCDQRYRSWVPCGCGVRRVSLAARLLTCCCRCCCCCCCCCCLQERVYQRLSQHYVSEVLTGQAVVENAAGLWAQALANAACNLLRYASACCID